MENIKLTAKQEDDLLFLKVLVEYKENEGYESLNDVIYELFEEGSNDNSGFLESVIALTEAGLVESNLAGYTDLIDAEYDYSIEGLTGKGEQYIKEMLKKPSLKERFIDILKSFDRQIGKLTNANAYKVLLDILSNIVKAMAH